MSETHISWRRIIPLFIGLLSLTVLAAVLIDRSESARWNEVQVARNQIQEIESRDVVGIHYTDKEYHFTLDLPENWQGYRVFATEVPDYGERLLSISLPTERYQENLVAPQDLRRGVMLVGIRAVSKDYIKRERERCMVPSAKTVINNSQGGATRKGTVTLEGGNLKLANACLSLADPESDIPVDGKKNYLTANQTHYFYMVPLEVFDNGFQEVPDSLMQEIKTVYQNFHTW